MFFYYAALYFIFVDWFAHFGAAMRIAFGTSQWVSFSVLRNGQQHGFFHHAALRFALTFSLSRFGAVMRVATCTTQRVSLAMLVNSLAMHLVAAG